MAEPASKPPATLSLRQHISKMDAEGHFRSSQVAQLEFGQELMAAGRLDEALAVLGPLWKGMKWRGEGWWDVVGEVGFLVSQAVRKRNVVEKEKLDVVVAVGWERMSRVFGKAKNKEGTSTLESLSLEKWLDEVEVKLAEEERIVVTIREEDVVSFLAATFAFEKGEGKVGEGGTGQLTVCSDALEESEAAEMDEVRIVFEGGMRTVVLRQRFSETQETISGEVIHDLVELRDASMEAQSSEHNLLVGETDLRLLPGQTKVFEFICPLREAGEVKALTATFSMVTEKIDLDYIASFSRTVAPDVWWCQSQSRKRLVRVDPHSMRVLPKPPKMDMEFVELQEQYYTNETISLKLDISNGEDDASVAKLDVSIIGDQVPAPPFNLKIENGEVGTEIDDADANNSELDLGTISSSGSLSTVLELLPSTTPAIYDLTLVLSYHIVSEPETPISKTTTIRLIVVSPFEANYDFSPAYDPTPWPSFFSAPSLKSEKSDLTPYGLAQKWNLTARYASFALTSLLINSISLSTLSLNGGIACSFTPLSTSIDLLEVHPKTIESYFFSIHTQKLGLDDRRSASLDLSLDISWQRSADTPACVTSLPIPRLLVASSEPRVLAFLAPTISNLADLGLLHLDYVVENPSMHFLTFGLAMTTSDSFAFSGLKSGTLQLLPLSRRRIRIRILPTVRGEWIRPVLIVRDKYFQKVLRVVSTGTLRQEKEGVGVWIPTGEEEEEGLPKAKTGL